jgi:hypothetical protein
MLNLWLGSIDVNMLFRSGFRSITCTFDRTYLISLRAIDIYAVIPGSALHHLGMNPQANSKSPLKWTARFFESTSVDFSCEHRTSVAGGDERSKYSQSEFKLFRSEFRSLTCTFDRTYLDFTLYTDRSRIPSQPPGIVSRAAAPHQAQQY